MSKVKQIVDDNSGSIQGITSEGLTTVIQNNGNVYISQSGSAQADVNGKCHAVKIEENMEQQEFYPILLRLIPFLRRFLDTDHRVQKILECGNKPETGGIFPSAPLTHGRDTHQ